MITPLCLLQARADPAAVTPLPLPGAGFNRALTLVSRHGDYGELQRTIALSASEIFRTHWQPELARLAPWLTDKVSFLHQ